MAGRELQVHVPTPPAPPGPPAADADSVDVGGLFRAIFGRKGLILGLMLLFGALLYLAARFMEPVYTAEAKVILAPRNVQVSQTDAVVSSVEVTEPEIFSEMAVMQSNTLLGDLIDQIGLNKLEGLYYDQPRTDAHRETRVASLIDKIHEDLRVQRESESFVVAIRFEGNNAELVTELTNGLADLYIEQDLSSRRSSVRQATQWIEELVAEAQAQVQRTETALTEAKAASLQSEGSSYDNASQQLANLTSELAVARAGLAAAEATYAQLQTVLESEGALGLAMAVTSPLLEKLLSERLEAKRKDDEWARSYGTDHPQRARLIDQIEGLDAQLELEARRVIEQRAGDVVVAESRMDSLSESVQALEDQLAGISGNTVGLRQLELEAAAARKYYETLLARLSSAAGQDRLQLPEARVIDRAPVPEAPSAPRPKLLGMFGALLGLTAGIVAAVVMEMTRTTYRTRREIEARTGQRVLATLPRMRGRDMRKVIKGLRGQSTSLFGERLRHLKTQLFLRRGGAHQQVIMVTSSRPNEGKSMVSMALAEMAVLAGKQVIVVDADLRGSKLVKDFGWIPEHDFTDFVLDRCALDEAILTDEDLGIHVLPTAKHNIEAADELRYDWLKPMMDELRLVYDVIIVDAPPLLNVADGLVLGRVADGIVYVVGWDSTSRHEVAEGLDALRAMRLGVAGIVLNKVDPRYTETAFSDGYGHHGA